MTNPTITDPKLEEELIEEEKRKKREAEIELEEQNEQAYKHAPSALSSLAGLAYGLAFLRNGPLIIEDEHDYQEVSKEILNNKKLDEKSLKGKKLGKEHIDYLYGSIENPSSSSLHQDVMAEIRKRANLYDQHEADKDNRDLKGYRHYKKYKKLLERYEKKKKETYRDVNYDPSVVRLKEKAEEEAEARFKLHQEQNPQLLRLNKKELEKVKSDFFAKIEEKRWDEFVERYPKKAEEYAKRKGEKHDPIRKAVERREKIKKEEDERQKLIRQAGRDILSPKKDLESLTPEKLSEQNPEVQNAEITNEAPLNIEEEVSIEKGPAEEPKTQEPQSGTEPSVPPSSVPQPPAKRFFNFGKIRPQPVHLKEIKTPGAPISSGRHDIPRKGNIIRNFLRRIYSPPPKREETYSESDHIPDGLYKEGQLQPYSGQSHPPRGSAGGRRHPRNPLRRNPKPPIPKPPLPVPAGAAAGVGGTATASYAVVISIIVLLVVVSLFVFTGTGEEFIGKGPSPTLAPGEETSGTSLDYTISFRDPTIFVSDPQTVKKTVLNNWPNAQLQNWDEIVRRSIENGWNSAFVLTLWIEETGAQGVSDYSDPLGCDPSNPTTDINISLSCLFNSFNSYNNFEDFMCVYGGDGFHKAPCFFEEQNPNFPGGIKNWYSILVPGGITEKPQSPPATPPQSNPDTLKQDIIDNFGITMNGFDQEHLQWAWDKFWEISNTKFNSLVRGSVITANSYSEQIGCRSLYLAQYSKELFQVILIHELGHIIRNCNNRSESFYNDHLYVLNTEGPITNYARTACTGGTDTASEDYAEMITYYLNPGADSQTAGCAGRGPNPYLNNNNQLHYNLSRDILGSYP